MNNRADPISTKYFVPVERAEKASAGLFYANAVASLAVLVIDKIAHPIIYASIQTLFGLLVFTSFVLGLVTKLYLVPRGADKRVSDFVSAAFSVSLTPDRTAGYYNNTAADPTRRSALQLLENCYFTKEIVRLMCKRQRVIVSVYVVLWIIVMIYRDAPMDFVLVAIQVVFSEQIVSSIVRMEWLRSRTERIFDALFRQLNTTSQYGPCFSAYVIEQLVCYENAKATSNITTSSKIFHANNARLSGEWDRIRGSLGA